ncbi:hypothetical protein HPB50_000106 [Hyalomma asiaticum]|uniref:Uncharacterized protein n=1 Tax=Hyalomma asiaticum TaxID=266040 RepID=A0ACB7SXN7_HYAAI|nr:hypothetical protein HPB50_000106 [Hyalomma asiaticum]
MKCTLAAILYLGLEVCAVSARAKPEDVSASVGGFDGKRVEDEPFVDESLREVVQTIAEDEELDGRSDDHFLRDMWDTTKEAFKEAFRTIKDSVIGAFRTAKDSIKYAAKSAGRQIKDKATEIVSTLWTKLTGGHAVVYSEASAYKLPENDYTLEAAFGDISNETAQEAILVGRILLLAASELEQEDAHDRETDEYSFRNFWAKLGKAVKRAAEKAVVFLYDIGKEVKSSVEEVVRAALAAAVDTAKEKAKEKAVLIVTKIMDKMAANMDSSDFENNAEFIKHLRKGLEQVGRLLIKEATQILSE